MRHVANKLIELLHVQLNHYKSNQILVQCIMLLYDIVSETASL